MSLLAVAGLQAPATAVVQPPDRTLFELTKVTPTRLLDTRDGVGGHLGPVAGGGTVDLDIRAFAPSAKAVVLNMTVTGPRSAGFATAYPSASAPDDPPGSVPAAPRTSTLNFAAGRTVANQVVVKVPDNGRVALYTSVTAHLLVDVTGYYERIEEPLPNYPGGGATSPGPYLPTTPTRVLDTRTGLGARKGLVDPDYPLFLSYDQLAGRPSDRPRAAVLNVTATGATGSGFITLDPWSSRPTTSLLNVTRGATVAAMAFAGGDGVELYSSVRTHLVVDLVGWVPSSNADYQRVISARLLDTRSGLGASKGIVPGGGSVDVTVAGRGGVPAMSATHPPVAVEVNVTAVSPTGSGYITAYDASRDRPQVSMLNYAAGETRSNSATVKLSADGKLRLYASARTHVVVDVVGYFVAAVPPARVSTVPLPGATVGRPYRAALSVSGGVGPFTWTADQLPDGLSLDPATGGISGTPTTPGKTSIYVSARDSEGVYAYQPGGTGLYVHASSGDSVTQVAAGSRHTCAVLTDGAVQCWGDNTEGAIGSQTLSRSTVPVTVPGLSGRATAVATGYSHSCALFENGDVWCWGGNAYGQLGNGSTSYRSPPSRVAGLSGPVVAIAAGSFHTCAVLADRTVSCWGTNTSGQLGDGTTKASRSPVAVEGLADIASISAATTYTCAISSEGGVSCWGGNAFGQLGNGTQTGALSPVAVPGLESGVASIASGGSHNCAVLSSGEVKCWGANSTGVVTPGGTQSSAVLTPTAIPGLGGGATAVSVGGLTACAILARGETRCWGSGANGVLGTGTAGDGGALPSTVLGLAGATDISVGGAHACAVGSHAETRCWGSNEFGQVGDAFTTNRLSPETVVGLEGSS